LIHCQNNRVISQNRSKRVTLKDVARHAGVSVMTVSNVINDWPRVTDETRQKVRASIEELGYRPNVVARSLVTGRTHTIGVVIADLMNPFFGQAVRGCEDVLYEQGYSLLLCNTNEDPCREHSYLEMLVGRGVDGLLMFGSRSSYAEVAEIVPGSIPIVAESSPIKKGNAIVLNLESRRGAHLATQHLIEMGHRRIGHLAGPLVRPAGRLRKEGYFDTLDAAGIPSDLDLVVVGHPSIRGGYRAARQLLSKHPVTALFCFNDLMAIGAMVACVHMDLRIPQDIALVGFDDIPLAAFVEPALTTIRVEQYQMGRLAAGLLLERLSNGETAWQQMDIPVQLIVRNSTGAQRLSKEQVQEMFESLAISEGLDLYAGAEDYLDGTQPETQAEMDEIHPGGDECL
jgi:DNA-binding LacI/PurR family transcriptional regulator